MINAAEKILPNPVDYRDLSRKNPHDLLKGIRLLEFLNDDRSRGWVPIPIRMILGAGFMVHGWAKWNRGPAAFAELLKQARVPLPLANAWLVTVLEILGGLALLTGAFVALVSIPLIFSMLGAMFTVNIKYGFSAVNTMGLTPEGPQLGPPGYEINLLYIAGLVALRWLSSWLDRGRWYLFGIYCLLASAAVALLHQAGY